MISVDLNQLLKKIKRASILLHPAEASLPPPPPPSPLVCIYRVFFFCLSCLPGLLPPPRPVMRASHVEKRDYLRHGIENAARASLSDARLPRFWSGFRFEDPLLFLSLWLFLFFCYLPNLLLIPLFLPSVFYFSVFALRVPVSSILLSFPLFNFQFLFFPFCSFFYFKGTFNEYFNFFHFFQSTSNFKLQPQRRSPVSSRVEVRVRVGFTRKRLIAVVPAVSANEPAAERRRKRDCMNERVPRLTGLAFYLAHRTPKCHPFCFLLVLRYSSTGNHWPRSVLLKLKFRIWRKCIICSKDPLLLRQE